MRKNYLTFLLLALSLCIFAQAAYAQVIPSAFNVEIGKHVYYSWENELFVRGRNFSAPNSWSTDQYIVLHAPGLDLTYTHSPSSVSEVNSDLLVSSSHRLDVELKLGLPVKPLVVAEYSSMNLRTITLVEDETMPIKAWYQVGNQEINEIYGGAGATFEFPLADALLIKAAASYQFINKNGYEASAGIDWTSPEFADTEIHVLVGASIADTSCSWGRSSSKNVFAEIGLVR